MADQDGMRAIGTAITQLADETLVLRAGQVFDGERTLGQATVVIQDGPVLPKLAPAAR